MRTEIGKSCPGEINPYRPFGEALDVSTSKYAFRAFICLILSFHTPLLLLYTRSVDLMVGTSMGLPFPPPGHLR